MQLVIESNPIAVRDGLARLMGSENIRQMDKGARSAAEIVLAEVLNNIVEHAYAECSGTITIDLQHHPKGVFVTIRDLGNSFPTKNLPQGLLPEIDSFKNLPEGGFGWYLIRSFVLDLSYRREGACNRLSFCLPAADSLG